MSAVVIDSGSCKIKAGLAGDDAPSFVFPSVVGIPRAEGEKLCGDAAIQNRETHRIFSPISRGFATNWDQVSDIWRHTFSDVFHVAPEEHPVLLSEAPLNPGANRMKMAQIMFETFNVPSICIQIQAALALYASGHTSGMVVDAGKEIIRIVPVNEGHCVANAIQTVGLGGEDLTNYLMRILSERGYTFVSETDRANVNEIKEKMCFVSEDFAADMSEPGPDKSYSLPDGTTIAIGTECFRCPEVLFNPTLIGKEDNAVDVALFTSSEQCDHAIRDTLRANIVLAGGTTMFRGFAERLQGRMINLCPPGKQVVIRAAPERTFFAWMGGSIMATLSTFPQNCITRADYDEAGPDRVLTKWT
ncbi:putative Actin; muscle-type [Paratrimastix pyriformis]|uniref:Actin n=1 Tax=Paratrimastix pyriformis TaxID=342808 RepID=A0ABQ8UP96_9EUKA|nr:putative Actin; muscle-type [Paratrimastix pyriformis]